MKLSFRLLIILLVTSCSNNVTKGNITDCDSFPADPIAYIYLQPYDDFTQQEATKLASKITKGLSKQLLPIYDKPITHVCSCQSA